jgi:hypothetical protein
MRISDCAIICFADESMDHVVMRSESCVRVASYAHTERRMTTVQIQAPAPRSPHRRNQRPNRLPFDWEGPSVLDTRELVPKQKERSPISVKQRSHSPTTQRTLPGLIRHPTLREE